MLDVLTVALGNKGGLDGRAISQLLSTQLLSETLPQTRTGHQLYVIVFNCCLCESERTIAVGNRDLENPAVASG